MESQPVLAMCNMTNAPEPAGQGNEIVWTNGTLLAEVRVPPGATLMSVSDGNGAFREA